MTAAANGTAASSTSRANRSMPAQVLAERRPAGSPGPGRARRRGRSASQPSGGPAARGSVAGSERCRAGRDLAGHVTGRSRHGADDAGPADAGAAELGRRRRQLRGRDEPARPRRGVEPRHLRQRRRSRRPSSCRPARRACHLEVDDRAVEVEERDRVAGRRPDRRERAVVVGHPEQLGAGRRRRGSRRRSRSCRSSSPRCTCRRATAPARGSPGPVIGERPSGSPGCT